jgi:transposase
MEHYAGIDVSLESSSVCIVDATDGWCGRRRLPASLRHWVGWLQQLGPELARIGLEAGPLSQWLYAAMRDAESTVVVLKTP